MAFWRLALKTIFFFFFDSDCKIVFLISYLELFVTNQGGLEICLFRVAFFIHRIAYPKGHSGEFLHKGNFKKTVHSYKLYYNNVFKVWFRTHISIKKSLCGNKSVRLRSLDSSSVYLLSSGYFLHKRNDQRRSLCADNNYRQIENPNFINNKK